MKKSLFQWAVLAAAVAALAVLGFRVLASRPSDKFLKPVQKAPAFSFRDRSGRTFASSELAGKVWVADFIFAHCAGSCPFLSQQMSFVQRDWKGNPDLKLVTFTVDPERDTVAALKQYADDYHALEDQWFFLTGRKKDLYRVIREGFKVPALQDFQGGPGFEFIHSTALVLVDAKGMIRGFYDGQSDAEVQKLHRDIRYLMSSRSHA